MNHRSRNVQGRSKRKEQGRKEFYLYFAEKILWVWVCWCHALQFVLCIFGDKIRYLALAAGYSKEVLG